VGSAGWSAVIDSARRLSEPAAVQPHHRRPRHLTPLLIAVLIATVSACGDEPDPVDRSTASTNSPPSTTSAPTTIAAPTTVAPAHGSTTTEPSSDVGDFEGQRYDFGEIIEVRRDGRLVVVIFNRQQVYTEDGSLHSGADLTSEPVFYGNTDMPYVDESKATRRFVLAEEAKVLRIADPVPCASDENPAEPIWDELSVDDLVAGAWRDRLMDSLSFNADGKVGQIRLSTGC